MSERLVELDPEQDLLEAFACFDDGDKGYVKGDELREWLSTVGDRMSKEEVRPVVCLLLESRADLGTSNRSTGC